MALDATAPALPRRATMRALAKLGPGPDALALSDREVPVANGDDVLIEVAACGVCGSDLHIRAAHAPSFASAFPQWLGHEYAGTVVAVGRTVTSVAVGDHVTAEPSAGCGHCTSCIAGAPNVCPERRFEAGGFAPWVAVPAARVHRLPDGCPSSVGALIEPLACAVHAVTEMRPPSVGATCVVVGPGPLGLLVALVARSQGARVAVVGRGRRPRRLELVRNLGIEQVIDVEADGALDAIERWTSGGADHVFGCAGGSDAVALGLSLVRPKGRYTELALAGASVAIDLDTVVRREIELGGAVSHRPESWLLALELITTGAIRTETLEGLITATYPLERWSEAFDAAAGREEGKVLVLPRTTTLAPHCVSSPSR